MTEPLMMSPVTNEGRSSCAGVGIEEMDGLVIGAKDDLGNSVGPLPNHGLSGPTRAAPEARHPGHRGRAAHGSVSPGRTTTLSDSPGSGPVP